MCLKAGEASGAVCFKARDLACKVKSLCEAPGPAGCSGAGYKGVIVPSERKLDVAAVKSLVVAGWTGRNVAALEAHIKELEAIGVKRPKTVPIFYRVAYSLLSPETPIE